MAYSTCCQLETVIGHRVVLKTNHRHAQHFAWGNSFDCHEEVEYPGTDVIGVNANNSGEISIA